MKLNDVQMYKNIGTIQMSKNEDGEKCYLYTHLFFNRTREEDTIKGAKEMLDYYEADAQKIREALRVLKGSGYKVFKEMA